ncbi:MAG TPA: hypothetical protein VEF04_19355, partial [Blastocatellia bacterium]|nr:hypothetical protein [Blastocatellia bacterium]
GVAWQASTSRMAGLQPKGAQQRRCRIEGSQPVQAEGKPARLLHAYQRRSYGREPLRLRAWTAGPHQRAVMVDKFTLIILERSDSSFLLADANTLMMFVEILLGALDGDIALDVF